MIKFLIVMVIVAFMPQGAFACSHSSDSLWNLNAMHFWQKVSNVYVGEVIEQKNHTTKWKFENVTRYTLKILQVLKGEKRGLIQIEFHETKEPDGGISYGPDCQVYGTLVVGHKYIFSPTLENYVNFKKFESEKDLADIGLGK